MTEYTYTHTALARFGDGYVIVPDAVAEDQAAWSDSMSPFPAIPCHSTGAALSGVDPVLVYLDGDAYGLGTPGTGDMIVRDAEIENDVVYEWSHGDGVCKLIPVARRDIDEHNNEPDCYELIWIKNTGVRYFEQRLDTAYGRLDNLTGAEVQTIREYASTAPEDARARINEALAESGHQDGADSYHDQYGRFFGRVRDDGNVDVLHFRSGVEATRLDASVYPVGSRLSARYEHPKGIVLTREDADRIGLEIE